MGSPLFSKNAIRKDLQLVKLKFPTIPWETVGITFSQYTCYRPGIKLIEINKELADCDWSIFHELGHAAHHLKLNFKRYKFPAEYKFLITLYWDLPPYKRDYVEIFADVFADTMMRYLHPKCRMFDHNKKMIKLLGGAN